jgi:hypothetical protein
VADVDDPTARLSVDDAPAPSVPSSSATGDGAGPPTAAMPPSRRGRSVAATILLLLAGILAPVSVVTVWAAAIVSDTDRWVETVAPIAADPGVQAAVADEVTATIMESLDVEALTADALEQVAQQQGMPPRVAELLPGLAAPLAAGVEDFTRARTLEVLADEQFVILWAAAHREAHPRLIALLSGEQVGAVTVDGDQLTIDLGPVVEEVKARLVQRGFEAAARLPATERTFVLAESAAIGQSQRVYATVTTLGVWLPIGTVILFVTGVLLARGRRRALLRGSLWVVAAVVAVGLTLTVVRLVYVATSTTGALPVDSVANVYDAVLAPLRVGLRMVAGVGIVIALAAFLSGPAPVAVRTRALLDRPIGRARGGSGEPAGPPSPAGRWANDHRTALALAAVMTAGLTLLFWSGPTTSVIVGVAVVLLVVLAGIAVAAWPVSRSKSLPHT